MVCSRRHSFTFCFCLLFLLILSTSQVRYKVEGRLVPKSDSFSQSTLRARIGSRPPRCERRCNSCQHCEAIQVPTNPQVGKGSKKSSTTLISSIAAYVRGDGNSNYKPMSWKCKCGDIIYNP